MQPLVAPNPCNARAVPRIDSKHSSQERLAGVRHVGGGRGVFAALDLPEEDDRVLIIEGKSPTYQRVKDHTERPDVHQKAAVFNARYDLGCCVVGGAATCLELFKKYVLRGVDELYRVGEREVRNLDVVLSIDEQVLWFEIPVDDIVVVAVLDPAENLKEQSTRLVLCHRPPVGKEVKEVPPRAVIQHHVVLFLRLNELKQPAHVRVRGLLGQELEDLHLADDLVRHLLLLNPRLLHRLDRHNVPRVPVRRAVHLAVGAAADLLLEGVAVDLAAAVGDVVEICVAVVDCRQGANALQNVHLPGDRSDGALFAQARVRPAQERHLVLGNLDVLDACATRESEVRHVAIEDASSRGSRLCGPGGGG
mmetsp:Transcript_17302/g.33937  ORF Transcript_17302/g.33937 Transcript_17302/m.33937 type:complete len:364 (-) Transcript_17302:207-1298(-)